MSKSYMSKVTKLQKKLAKTELLVISLPEVKAQLPTAKGVTGSANSCLPIDPYLLVDPMVED